MKWIHKTDKRWSRSCRTITPFIQLQIFNSSTFLFCFCTLWLDAFLCLEHAGSPNHVALPFSEKCLEQKGKYCITIYVLGTSNYLQRKLLYLSALGKTCVFLRLDVESMLGKSTTKRFSDVSLKQIARCIQKEKRTMKEGATGNQNSYLLSRERRWAAKQFFPGRSIASIVLFVASENWPLNNFNGKTGANRIVFLMLYSVR